MEYKVGDLIDGRFEVKKAIRGGFGMVYISQNKGTGEMCAIKAFQDRLFKEEGGERLIKNFHQEAYVWLRLCPHPNITQVFLIAEFDYKPHVVMEYVESTLAQKIKEKSLSIERSLNLSIQFCNGMIYANSVDVGGGRRGIVHRDIKPSNILLTEDDITKIADFGLVKVLGTPTVDNPVGTPEYMSPEQFETMDVDQRSDIYSFGVALYQMVTGRLPFHDPDRSWEFYRDCHNNVRPKSPHEIDFSIPSDLEVIVLRCLEKRPRSRFENFIALRASLVEAYMYHYGKTAEGIQKANMSDYVARLGHASGLIEVGKARAMKSLLKDLKDKNDAIRLNAAITLTKMGVPAVESLVEALSDKDDVLRSSSAAVLGMIGDARAIDPLVRALNDEDSSVREKAARALEKIRAKGNAG